MEMGRTFKDFVERNSNIGSWVPHSGVRVDSIEGNYMRGFHDMGYEFEVFVHTVPIGRGIQNGRVYKLRVMEPKQDISMPDEPGSFQAVRASYDRGWILKAEQPDVYQVVTDIIGMFPGGVRDMVGEPTPDESPTPKETQTSGMAMGENLDEGKNPLAIVMRDMSGAWYAEDPSGKKLGKDKDEKALRATLKKRGYRLSENKIFRDREWMELIWEKSVPEKHQIKIAKDTLKMPDAMAKVMGGMTKKEAREVLKKHGIKEQEFGGAEDMPDADLDDGVEKRKRGKKEKRKKKGINPPEEPRFEDVEWARELYGDEYAKKI